MAVIEVEAKYRLTESIAIWKTRLAGIGAQDHVEISQSDEYFAHPVRDFATTGEAFRLRTCGDQNMLTYKGPLLDEQTKTRSEIEVGVAPGAAAAEDMRRILAALGFASVLAVTKSRCTMTLTWEGRPIEVCLDRIEGLGEFLELEATGDDASWSQTRDSLLRLAEHLELSGSERRSYLELLLEQRDAPTTTGDAPG